MPVPEAQALQKHWQHFWAVTLLVWEPEYAVRKKDYFLFLLRESSWLKGNWGASEHWKIPSAFWLAIRQRFEVCRAWFITSLGSWEIWQRQRCPLTLGETGSNKGNKSLPRRPFWPQCRCTSGWGRVSFPFVCWACSSYRSHSQPHNTQNGEKRRDVPVMPERGHKLLMALSSQRKQSLGETVSRKTMCRSGTVTRLVHICGL